MLRDIIPQIISVKDSKEDPNIYNILVDTLENEYETIKEYIDDLSTLLKLSEDNPQKEELLDVVGVFSYKGLDFWVQKQIAFLHKIKGTPYSWKKYLKWLVGDTITSVEMCKDEVFEYEEWNQTDALYSNRVTFCEVSCETSGETAGSDKNTYFDYIGDISPAHVVLHTDAEVDEVSDSLRTFSGYFGCHSSCETVCEGSCEVTDEDISSNTGYLDDTIGSVEDSFNLEAECISDCESSCVGCCETSCECDTCELFCETGCETYATHGGGAGGGACTDKCETECVIGCETECQYDCEDNCQHDCEDDCQHDCEDSCQADYCTSCQCSHTSDCGSLAE